MPARLVDLSAWRWGRRGWFSGPSGKLSSGGSGSRLRSTMLNVITLCTAIHTLSLMASAHWAVWQATARPATSRSCSPSPGRIEAAGNEKQVSSRFQGYFDAAVSALCRGDAEHLPLVLGGPVLHLCGLRWWPSRGISPSPSTDKFGWTGTGWAVPLSGAAARMEVPEIMRSGRCFRTIFEPGQGIPPVPKPMRGVCAPIPVSCNGLPETTLIQNPPPRSWWFRHVPVASRT